MNEQLEVSALIGKKVKERKKEHNVPVIQKHNIFCNHSSGFDNFSILASNSNDFRVILRQSLLINRDHTPLNKNRHLLTLELIDD